MAEAGRLGWIARLCTCFVRRRILVQPLSAFWVRGKVAATRCVDSTEPGGRRQLHLFLGRLLMCAAFLPCDLLGLDL